MISGKQHHAWQKWLHPWSTDGSTCQQGHPASCRQLWTYKLTHCSTLLPCVVPCCELKDGWVQSPQCKHTLSHEALQVLSPCFLTDSRGLNERESMRMLLSQLAGWLGLTTHQVCCVYFTSMCHRPDSFWTLQKTDLFTVLFGKKTDLFILFEIQLGPWVELSAVKIHLWLGSCTAFYVLSYWVSGGICEDT